MLPLLMAIMQRLHAVADSPDAAPRLLLYAGHDTVVAPLLAALGAMRAPGVCAWPPYASHVVLELWEAAGGASTVDARARHTLRVLFNGRVITPHLAGCERLLSGGDPEHCALRSLSATVDALRSEFDRGCGIAVPP
jgi:hypothetical protein